MTDDSAFGTAPDEAIPGSDEPEARESTRSEAIASARAEAQEALAYGMRRAAALKAEAAGYRYAANVSPGRDGQSPPSFVDLTTSSRADQATDHLDAIDQRVAARQEQLLGALQERSGAPSGGAPTDAEMPDSPPEADGHVHAAVAADRYGVVLAETGLVDRISLPARLQGAVAAAALVIFVVIAVGAFLASL